MGTYVAWTIAALMVLTGFVLLLFVPGIGILALLALAFGIVMAAVLAISYGGARRGGMTSDVEERRAEHRGRQRDQRRRRKAR